MKEKWSNSTTFFVANISLENDIFDIIDFPSERAAQISILCVILLEEGILTEPLSLVGVIFISIICTPQF